MGTTSGRIVLLSPSSDFIYSAESFAPVFRFNALLDLYRISCSEFLRVWFQKFTYDFTCCATQTCISFGLSLILDAAFTFRDPFF